MRYLIPFLLILAVSCGGTTRQRKIQSETEMVTVPRDGEVTGHGIYPVERTHVSFDSLESALGPTSSLSPADKEHYWQAIIGKQVKWTGQIVEMGDLRSVAQSVSLKVGKSGSYWDTLVFFEPRFAERLRRIGSGGFVTFSGIVRSYEPKDRGLQVTLSSGRLH